MKGDKKERFYNRGGAIPSYHVSGGKKKKMGKRKFIFNCLTRKGGQGKSYVVLYYLNGRRLPKRVKPIKRELSQRRLEKTRNPEG